MALTITQVDAFASEPFGGNPAAVCLLPEPADAAWMQRVAREMNLSETAFLVRRDDGAFDLRWFTPGVEVDLCGHATLASAHVLWESGHLAPDAPAVFHTLSGRLSAVRRDRWIEMDFPAEPDESVSGPDWLADALGAEPIYVGRNRLDYLGRSRRGGDGSASGPGPSADREARPTRCHRYRPRRHRRV